jgi:nitrogen regulatory protein PII
MPSVKEIKAIIQPFMLEKVVDALVDVEGLPGVSVSHVDGFGKGWERFGPHKQVHGRVAWVHKVKLEVMVPNAMVETVVDTIQSAAHTGNTGDGKIWVYDIRESVRIRTGERGEAAL